jgi:predicted SprT family Zn-dependent metalloprotease
MKELYTYFNTPFKTPKLKFYLGKAKIGLPYFLPRKNILFNSKYFLEYPKKVLIFVKNKTI